MSIRSLDNEEGCIFSQLVVDTPRNKDARSACVGASQHSTTVGDHPSRQLTWDAFTVCKSF